MNIKINNNLCYKCYKKSNLLKIIGKENWKKAKSWKYKRSKNEKYFASLCKKYFKDVKENSAQFNGWDVDAVIEDHKIAVEWNRVWHFKKLFEKYKLKEKANRDKLKAKEIKAAGYKLYVIKDEGSYDKSFVEKKFEEFIKHLHTFH